ncbi:MULTISPECIES: HtaA domain-containing protein [unclassified Streptomyces]|uniref:HtaA domain-containing protein n=1 Tax=unclassified Streptomyces TaxID=2593676 RepID=UPI001660198F|nr:MULTISPECIES: HtaA domain-containing protein [unclassified Streptomyces]MBD0710815.1 Htaa domain protein [Streptomyces sp. CBMA291]MBD0717771.1 Htaa domain protein [Streptomyces sp. CBMA370]
MPLPRSARVLAVTLFTALLAALVPATAAHAESRTVQGGRLDWGIRSSFLSYVTGPVAQGSWGLTGGAATVGGGQFRFHSAQGSYDPATGAFEAAFSGGVHFTGHPKADGGNELDLTVSRPRVRVSGGQGTLYADMASKAKGSGRMTVTSGVPIATLNVGGIDMRGGGSPLSLTGVPATLTAQGATAFAGYYPAGTALDPISLTVDVNTPRQAPAATPPAATPAKPSATTDATATAKPSATASATGGLHTAVVDWGVRRTFREYVTGAVSQGEWALADGAQDGGALFRFPSGKGAYDPAKGTLDAAFAGSVRFTGAHLDLTLGKVAVKVSGGTGTLSADVTSAGKTDKGVPLVTFAARDLTPKNGLAVVTEAPATLTEGGAKAFGGMYKAGTEMDPVSLAVAVDAKAALPALPDLGSAPTTPAATPSAATSAPTAPADPAPVASAQDSGPSAGTYLAIGGGVLLVAVAAVFTAVRRRRSGAGTPAA